MFDEILNVELVRERADEQGRTIGWMIRQVGISKSSGYMMFREGLLPKDLDKRSDVLRRLGKVLGLEPRQMVLAPLRARETA